MTLLKVLSLQYDCSKYKSKIIIKERGLDCYGNRKEMGV